MGGIKNGDGEIESVLTKLRNPYAENGINCMTLAISKGQLWIRPSQSQHATPSSLAKLLHTQLSELKSITVIRRAEQNTLIFGDELWDYMTHRCLRDGVYWAHGQPKHKTTNLNDLEQGEIVEVSVRLQVARWELAPPVVSWCTWTREEWGVIVERARMIEDEMTAWKAEKNVERMKKLDEERRELDLEQTQQRERDAVAEVALQEWLVEERGQWLQNIWCMILLPMAVCGVSIIICRGVSIWTPSCYTYFC